MVSSRFPRPVRTVVGHGRAALCLAIVAACALAACDRLPKPQPPTPSTVPAAVALSATGR